MDGEWKGDGGEGGVGRLQCLTNSVDILIDDGSKAGLMIIVTSWP